MKRVTIFAIAALAIVPIPAFGDWIYEGEWGSRGTGNGPFQIPFGLAFSRNGVVYVTDSTNHRVQYFTDTGSFLGKWGTPGKGSGQFLEPVGVAAATDGNVYVAEWRNHRVQYFTWNGDYLGKWGSKGPGDGQFDRPCGITVAPTSLGRVKALFK
ncbi:MAG: hypothetical protein GTN49_12385 [candidate division Zixibacteria bacterium]|nr:hypothetical protein [candidate division Zixibacteria bacterium]